MHNEEKYPFHGTGVQGLEETDPARRIRFLKSILWTDESKFSREGITNFHNLHEWADKDSNPNWIKQISVQRQFSINVWAGVIGRTLVGPHILPDNLNGQNYLEFMINDLPMLLYDAEVPILDTDRPITFQQDECPAHWAVSVREHLNRCFPGNWRDGPIPWPARSPNLTPLDFFMWGRTKKLVYTTEITTREELFQRIEAAF
ncbi:uncharacterized protein [Leptinotarsa decemlineata]|uniref:uncharacterized protein n=1 Tax=Leptinotarsa decemlineata TaxID=7539 RepID=UPI003D3090D6